VTQPEGIKETPEQTADPGANSPGFMPAHINRLFDAIFGDWPHHNDGSHLNGGVDGHSTWQRHWWRIADLPTTHYSVQKGKVG
jgi:hypothetical protein